MTRTFLAIAFSFASLGADVPNLNPNVFGPDDPRTKMMGADVRRRMQEANLRESQAFAAVTTKEQWEKHRDERIRKLGAREDAAGTAALPGKTVASHLKPGYHSIP